jgi:hypothetical protein
MKTCPINSASGVVTEAPIGISPRPVDRDRLPFGPAQAPHFPPEHVGMPAAHIRYFIAELDQRLTLTPAQAAAFVGEIHTDAQHLRRVVVWLTQFEGEPHAEMSRREGSEAAD